MRVYRPAWLLPISGPPMPHGWVAVEEGRVAAVGGEGVPAPGPAIPLPGVAVLPGLVNAHTHLELSYLHRRIPPAPRFGRWVREVMQTRQQYPDPADPRIVEPAGEAIACARGSGTALFGDISNTLVTVPLLREQGCAARVFHELTGFMERDPDARVREARRRVTALDGDGDVRLGIAPHAPYSVSAGLFGAVRRDLDAHPGSVSSVHLGETPDEIELLRQGSGDLRRVLEELGRWTGDWEPPGVSPVEYLDRLGLIDPRVLVVHGVQFDAADVRCLLERRATIVVCPRSNRYVGVGDPPLARFYASGLPVALGTDSLASVADLNMFGEMAAVRALAPDVPARRILESATRTGAEALGFGGAFGTIAPGTRATLLAVRVPAGVADVEEYLVSGIAPADVHWLT